jgi:EAL domain-containing protein (putative c-di-GMP-specific phosphodiesterase class I)
VQAMLANPVDAAIVAFTVGLAHSLGVPVVAEGVEDEPTLTQLRDLGCDKVQGYVFTRPLPPEQFVCWMHARKEQV